MSYTPEAGPASVEDSSRVGALDGQARLLDVMSDLANPWPKWKQLLDEGGWFDTGDGMAVSAKRETTNYILRHGDEFSSAIELGLGNVRPLIPLNVDPPKHAKFRKLLDPIFAPRVMSEREDDLRRRVNVLIDGFIDRGECNFTEEFAEIFPSSVFLGLCGLPEEEMATFLHMRDGILHPEKIDPEALFDVGARQRVANATGQEIYDYFGALVEQRRAEPADDIVSLFISHEIDGEKLTDEEILDIWFLFVIAGLDTVSDSLTCFYVFLARNPEHRRQIVDDPSIIPAAVEELLRWESPVPGGVPRTATRAVTLPGGHHVEAGTMVMINYGAGNFDPEAFDDPFEVRFDRPSNPHIAFGGGVHRCLGSHLARRELRITLEEWHRRIPDYGIKPGHEELEYPPGLRHVKDLMLSWS